MPRDLAYNQPSATSEEIAHVISFAADRSSRLPGERDRRARRGERGPGHRDVFGVRPFGTLRQQAAVQQAWLKERLEGTCRWCCATTASTCGSWRCASTTRIRCSRAGLAHRLRGETPDHLRLLRRGPEKGVERLALGGSARAVSTRRPRRAGHLHPAAGRVVGHGPVAALREGRARAEPETIAVNISPDHNFADGLSAGEWERMPEALGPELEARASETPGWRWTTWPCGCPADLALSAHAGARRTSSSRRRSRTASSRRA